MADEPFVMGKITQLSTIPRGKYPSYDYVVGKKQAEQMPMPVKIPVDMHSEYMVDVWRVDLFGDGKSMVFTTKVDKLWVRVWTRFFFRSKWSRL